MNDHKQEVVNTLETDDEISCKIDFRKIRMSCKVIRDKKSRMTLQLIIFIKKPVF